MLTSNYLIIDRRPQRFAEMRVSGKVAVFIGDNGRPVDYGAVILDDSVYAALYCDEVRNITLVQDRMGEIRVITILWHTDGSYRQGTDALHEALGKHFSRQNLRINRYAEAIAEKLREGVKLRVTDAQDETGMVRCPECGMLNPPGSQYCLDCGADIPAPN